MLTQQCKFFPILKRDIFLLQAGSWSSWIKWKKKCCVMFSSHVRIIKWCGCLNMTGPSKHKMPMFEILNCQMAWMPIWRCLAYTWAQDYRKGVWDTALTCLNLVLLSTTPKCARNICSVSTGCLSCVPHVWSCLVLIAGRGSRSNSVISRSEKELPADLKIALSSAWNSAWKIFL